MIPVKLSLSGFISYRDLVEVDFNGFDLACISGANGAGKSSLLDGITWALFGKARKTDDSIINSGSERAEVEFTFSYESTIYRVQRVKTKGKTTILEFHIQNKDGKWKALTDRTLRGTEALIVKTLSLDYDTFINASFFLQGKADQFTQQTAANRKAILGSVLGLEIWEEYRKTAADERKLVDQKITNLDGRLQEINAELDQEAERNTRLVDLEKTLKQASQSRTSHEKVLEGIRGQAASLSEQSKLVETLKTQAERARQALEDQKSKLEARQGDKAKYAGIMSREKEIQQANKELAAIRKELESWEETRANFDEHDKRRNAPLTDIETARARLETELQNLQAQEKSIQQAVQTSAGQESQLQGLQAKLLEINSSIEERDRLEAQHQEALQRKAGAEAENPILKEEMEELKGRIDKLKGSNGAFCPTCGQELNTEERKRLIQELEAEGKNKGDRYRANQTDLKEFLSVVKTLKTQVSEYAKIDEQQREHTRLLDQTAGQIEQAKAQAAAWEKDGAPRLKEIGEQLKQENYAPEARKTLAEIDAELKKIGYDAASHDAAKGKANQLAQAETDLRELENAKAALTPLEREIKELAEKIEKDEKELAGQEKTYQEAAAVLEKARQGAPDLAEAENTLLDLQEQENKTRLEVGAAQQEVLVLADLKKRHTELEANREEHARQVAQYKALERAFGKDGVPAMLIEQALPQIEAKANEILERLSGGNMSIRFLTQQAYKAKRDDLKETLEIQISDSAGMRDYEMFSGGEAFRINFAIRLALSEILAQRAGARLQTLVIDEGFGSQDQAGRQRLIEAINMVRDDFAKILVITHIDSLKDAFPTRIEVEKTLRGSVVSVN